MPKRVAKNRLTKRTGPAKQIVVDRLPGPNKTVVRAPATLAEAMGDPVVIVPDEPPQETKLVRKVIRRRRAA
jgi:hypothetical protein